LLILGKEDLNCCNDEFIFSTFFFLSLFYID
jgi:hypothetical protein